MSGADWGLLGFLVACVVLAAMASGVETAMTSVNRFRVTHLVDEGRRGARTLERLRNDPNRFLSTVLVVNTVAVVLSSFAVTLLTVRLMPPRWGFVGQFVVSLAFSVFTLIFSEVTPKSFAIANAESIALLAARPIDVLSHILRPVLWFITLVARAATAGRGARAPFVTEEELMALLNVSEQEGVIEEQERDMINQIIEAGDKPVREVMVPRTDVTTIDRQASLEEVMHVLQETGHTRLPIRDGDVDRIIGLVHVKDLAVHLLAHRDDGEPFSLDAVFRPMTFTPESKRVMELLHEMQDERVHMKVVVDEYGGTAGVVTLEDLLEEIVGEIRDEYDIEEEEEFRLPDPHTANVDARFPMQELSEKLHLGIPESNDYDSVGGYVLDVLGEVPEAGATFDAGGVHWTVSEVDGNRILRLLLRSDTPWPDDTLVDAGLKEPPPRLQLPDPDAGE